MVVGTQAWYSSLVAEIFSDEDQKLILDIPMSLSWPSDKSYWWPTSDGMYTIKSGYWLGCLGHMRTWELNFGSLVVMDVLYKRHIRPNKTCFVSGFEEETILHVLFDCKYALEIWRLSGFRELMIDALNTSFSDRLRWIAGKVDKVQCRTIASLTWAAWFCRNKEIFEGIVVEPEIVAAGFVKLNEEYISYKTKVNIATSVSSLPTSATWNLPPSNIFKVNVDAHISGSFGVVIRGDKGQLLCAAVKKIRSNWAPEMDEAEAARFGVKLARRLGYSNVILECDALNVVRTIHNRQEEAAPVFLMFDDIVRISGDFNIFCCVHVRRAGNTAVRLVARWETDFDRERVCMNCFPQRLQTLADIDLK
ncbi:hypothetical protein POM88_020983 [Heracleum sosnowskyi]|uniref:RNase H type-1 domain-containing protein n=1 Tax=Heracleum sosnowskyi TaxID=360622 RepID=A0AAD8IF25_9APIA|nr:hypothetical protein POM88_020983 [Heracleum sosnowskyi]